MSRHSRWSNPRSTRTTSRVVRNLRNPELNPNTSELDFVGRYGYTPSYDLGDDYEQEFGGNRMETPQTGGGNSSGSASSVQQAVQALCTPQFVTPDRVEWEGDDCDSVSIQVPAAEKVPHYQNLLNPEFLNGIYLTHAIGKKAACDNVLARKPDWTIKTVNASAMYPMLTDSHENVFHVLTEDSDLWTQIKKANLWGQGAVFIGFNRADIKTEAWFGGVRAFEMSAAEKLKQMEYLRALFVPTGSPLQEKYAPEAFNAPKPKNFFLDADVPRKFASPPREHVLEWSRDFTQKYGAADLASTLRDEDYGFIGRSFYETMQNIERTGKKYPHHFVFFVGGKPTVITGIIVQIVATAVSVTVTALTGGTVTISPALVAKLLNTIIDFAQGKGDWKTLIMAAMDIAVTMLLSANGTGGKPLLGEQTQAIIKEAYTIAGTLVRTGDWRTAGVQVAQGLMRLAQSGAIKLPNTIKLGDQDYKLLDAALNMAFEPIVKEANIQREMTTSTLTAMVKGANEFRMGVQASIAGLARGVEKAEAMFNGALKTLEKIADKGVTSIVEDLNLRNAFMLTPNAAGLLTTPNLGNIAAAVMNIPAFLESNASTPEAQMSFAGMAAGLGISPSVFDGLQFDALMTAAEDAKKNKRPFTIPSTILGDRADDYRIKLEKCFNVAISESKDRATTVTVPERDSEGETSNGETPNSEETPVNAAQQSLAPVGTTTDANGVVTNPDGRIVGTMSPQGFVPTRSAAQNTSNSGASCPTCPQPSFSKAGYFKRGLQIPPYIRVIGGRTFACLEKVKVKTTDEHGKEKETDMRKCLPFLGDEDLRNDTVIASMIADYCTAYLPSGQPRTRPIAQLNGLRDGTNPDAAHPIGLQIACVAEAMLKENVSEAALRQLYDNLPNERMRSRAAATIGDEGIVHFEKYSRTSLPNGTVAPLEAGQRDYSAIFVWVAVEDAGRNCFKGWEMRSFIRNARILDAVGVPMSGMFTLNDTWKSLADGGAKEGAIFVRVMPNGTPHTGVVVKRDGAYLETIEANALANTGRGTDAALQRFRIPTTDAVDWKFFHVWEDSSVGALRLPVGGRCCVVPETAPTGATLGQPDPVQTPPNGTKGGWIPTEKEEQRDGVLRAARATVFAYHAPQVFGGNAAVYWKAVRVGISSTLLPKRVPDELRQRGFELNPDPFGEPLDNYTYESEGVIRYAYRRREYTARDYALDVVRRAQARAALQKEGKLLPKQKQGALRSSRTRFGLRDDGLSDAETLGKQIQCVAKGIAQRLPSAQALVSKYGGDNLRNSYSASDNTCAMFVWLFYQELANCMGASAAGCRFPKSSRVFDQDSTRASNDRNNLNKSLFHGAIANGIQPTRTPEVGAIFCKPRQSEEAANAQRNIPKDGIKGVGGHTGIVTSVTPQGFTTIESSNNAGEGNSSLIFTRSYSTSDVQSRGIWFLPVQSCILSGTPPQNAPAYCCPKEQTRGCATCTGGGVKQPDGTCKCPPNTTPDPQNPCNCKQNTVTTNSICAEAPPQQLDRDCRVDREWVRAVQGEQRDPNFAYSPQGCWKCEKIRSTTSSCNEPEPPRDPDCSSIWISKSPTHRNDTTRFKYSGSCWYCEKKPQPVERNPQCPPTVPASFGTGWENVPAGGPCTDTANYSYFKTSTGMCCFRKPKNPRPLERTPVERPPQEVPRVPQIVEVREQGSCRACEENEDVINEYELEYKDWDGKVILDAVHHTKENQWFAKVGDRWYPLYGDMLEVEPADVATLNPLTIQTVTPPSLQRDLQNVATMIARTETGEPNAVEGVKVLVEDLNKKVDALAIQNAGLDTRILQTLVNDVQKIRQSTAEAQSISPLDTKLIDSIVGEVSSKLTNFNATALEAKVNALETGMQQALQTIQRLPDIIKTTQEQTTNQAKAAALSTAQSLAVTAPPAVAEAVAEAVAKVAPTVPANASPAEAARIVADAAIEAANKVALDLPKGSPAAVQAAEAAKTFAASTSPITANAVAEVQRTVPKAVDMGAMQNDVADLKKILVERSASECVSDLVKKLHTMILRLESAAQTPESITQKQQLQSMLAPIVLLMNEKHQELLSTMNKTAQATVQATTQASSNAAAQAATQASAQLPSIVEDLKTSLAARADAASAQNAKLLESIVNDLKARSDAGANVQPLLPNVQMLQTAVKEGTQGAVEEALQSVMAKMQAIPAPQKAVEANYNAYNEQIPLLQAHLRTLQAKVVSAKARRDKAAHERALMHYLNTNAFYNQQCSTCPSCPSAVGYY